MAYGSVLFGECNSHIHCEIWMFEWRYNVMIVIQGVFISIANMIM